MIDVPDLARSWHRLRMVTSGLVFSSGLLLGAAWTWPGGYVVALLSLVALADAAIRAYRPERSALPAVMLDISLIGVSMILVNLQAAGVGAPFVYMIVAAAFLLSWPKAAIAIAYSVAWAALALSEVVMLPLTPEASPQLITAVAYAIFASNTVALVVVVARALDRSHRAKDQFLQVLSHEIRTPLTAVLAWSAMLKDGTLDIHSEEGDEAIEVISAEANEVAGLIDDLLVAARLPTKNVRVLAESVDVGNEILSVLFSTRLQMMNVNIDAIDGCHALGDRLRIRQIIRNLLTNAMRYGGPNVKIECSSNRTKCVVTVTDDGTSLNSTTKEMIFDPYVRGHTRDNAPEGLGLGLPISRSLARLMGGDIECKTDHRQTTFVLTLPAAPYPTENRPHWTQARVLGAHDSSNGVAREA